MVGYFLLWMSNGVGPILLVSPNHTCLKNIYIDFLWVQAWMADLCPSPEERSIQVGIATTLIFIIDSWDNGPSIQLICKVFLLTLFICLYSANLSGLASSPLQGRVQSSGWVHRRLYAGHPPVLVARPEIKVGSFPFLYFLSFFESSKF